jgi:hypothetical protein
MAEMAGRTLRVGGTELVQLAHRRGGTMTIYEPVGLAIGGLGVLVVIIMVRLFVLSFLWVGVPLCSSFVAQEMPSLTDSLVFSPSFAVLSLHKSHTHFRLTNPARTSSRTNPTPTSIRIFFGATTPPLPPPGVVLALCRMRLGQPTYHGPGYG